MRIFPSAVFLAMLSIQAVAQPQIAARFAYRTHTLGADSLPYRLFVPEALDTTALYPLVLALHGSGERGIDNNSHIISYRIATAWADPANQANYPCLVAAPQAAYETSWDDYVPVLSDLLDSLAREFPVDTNRLYITGLSMGGFGTFRMITTYPDRFAAAIPMSSGWSASDASTIAHLPIWNFHGTRDELVPVAWSREIMGALEDLGIPVVYTHCRLANCTGLPDSTIAMQVEAHAQALYTEFGSGLHNIWDQSYDYPHLFPWTFSQYRRIAGAVTLDAPASVLSGQVALTWSGGDPADSLEIWFSADRARSWEAIALAAPNTGTYLWNTASHPDAAVAELKVFIKNPGGFIYGTDRTGPFTLDNPGNGVPYVEISGREFDSGRIFEEDSLTLHYLAQDPEGDPLTIRISYRLPDGGNGGPDIVVQAQSDTGLQAAEIPLSLYPNSDRSRLVVSASDGALTGSDSTYIFKKQTPRLSGPPTTTLSGGGGRITIVVSNPAAITGDLYRLSFDDTLYAYTTYTVRNMTQSSTLLEAVPVPHEKYEGPEFDGLRLLIEDVDAPTADAEGSGWVSGVPTLIPVSPYLPTYLTGSGEITGYPFPYDYRVTFASDIIDTSSDFLPGLPAVPVSFAVDNITEARDAEFAFYDLDFSGGITNFDEIYLLEKDSTGALALGWGLSFAGSTEETLPQPGDVYEFRTLKPISSRDVYEFQGMVVAVAPEELPGQATLEQNYPNPFNPATRLRFTLPEAAEVRLMVYDVLGREVRSLVDGRMEAGAHTVTFDAAALASGVYFARIVAGEFVAMRRMLLLR
jgi:predicted esterase